MVVHLKIILKDITYYRVSLVLFIRETLQITLMLL